MTTPEFYDNLTPSEAIAIQQELRERIDPGAHQSLLRQIPDPRAYPAGTFIGEPGAGEGKPVAAAYEVASY